MSITIIRNLLLILLTITSGCVDAISFLGLGQVFTAAMTGNTVLFGLSVVHTDGLSTISYAVALLGFVTGAAIAAIVLKRGQDQSGWNQTVTYALCIELAALVLFAGIVSFRVRAMSGFEINFLIAILGVAMGVQGVAARRIGVSGVTTTVITSTLTGLVEVLVWNLSQLIGTPRTNQTPEKGKSVIPGISALTWILVIIGYGVGAAICGIIELNWHLKAIWFPIAIVLIVICAARAFLHPRRSIGKNLMDKLSWNNVNQ